MPQASASSLVKISISSLICNHKVINIINIMPKVIKIMPKVINIMPKVYLDYREIKFMSPKYAWVKLVYCPK